MSIRISGLLLGAAVALTVTAAPAQVNSANEMMPHWLGSRIELLEPCI